MFGPGQTLSHFQGLVCVALDGCLTYYSWAHASFREYIDTLNSTSCKESKRLSNYADERSAEAFGQVKSLNAIPRTRRFGTGQRSCILIHPTITDFGGCKPAIRLQ
jgi:hypothetical protein